MPDAQRQFLLLLATCVAAAWALWCLVLALFYGVHFTPQNALISGGKMLFAFGLGYSMTWGLLVYVWPVWRGWVCAHIVPTATHPTAVRASESPKDYATFHAQPAPDTISPEVWARLDLELQQHLLALLAQQELAQSAEDLAEKSAWRLGETTLAIRLDALSQVLLQRLTPQLRAALHWVDDTIALAALQAYFLEYYRATGTLHLSLPDAHLGANLENIAMPATGFTFQYNSHTLPQVVLLDTNHAVLAPLQRHLEHFPILTGPTLQLSPTQLLTQAQAGIQTLENALAKLLPGPALFRGR